MAALGDEFRSAREARGLTLSDVAEQIHIRSVYLSAIESEDWPSIGAPVYVRGFIRTYARFLGLDGEAAVTTFNQATPPERPVPVILAERGGSGLSLWAVLGVLIAAMLVAFVAYEWWSYTQAAPGGPLVSPPIAIPTAEATAEEEPGIPEASSLPILTPAPGLRHSLTIRLTQRSWLRVAIDGKTEIEGIFPPGTERIYSGVTADVRVGNAGGVTVSVGGRPPVPLGEDGDVVEQHFVL
jgi:hypothetical protein